MHFTDALASTRFTGGDRIAAERRASQIRVLTINQFGAIPSRQLGEMLDSLKDRLFQDGHENHHLLAEAAARLREY